MSMLVRKAFMFQIYPKKEQQTPLAVQFGHARFMYTCVRYFPTTSCKYAKIIINPQERGGVYYRDTANLLTELKRTPDHQWLRSAQSRMGQDCVPPPFPWKDSSRIYPYRKTKSGCYYASFSRWKRRSRKPVIRSLRFARS